MRLRQQTGIALIAGVAAEAILIAPLFLVSYSHLADAGPLADWILALGQLQSPGEPLIWHLLHTEPVRQFVAHYRNSRAVFTAATISIILIQAILLSPIAFGAQLMLRTRVARRILARRRRVLFVAFGPPALLLLLAIALMFPYLIDPDLAQLLEIVSYAWLVLAAILVAMTRLRTASTT